MSFSIFQSSLQPVIPSARPVYINTISAEDIEQKIKEAHKKELEREIKNEIEQTVKEMKHNEVEEKIFDELENVMEEAIEEALDQADEELIEEELEAMKEIEALEAQVKDVENSVIDRKSQMS